MAASIAVQETGGRLRPVYTRVEAAGLAMITGGVVIFLVAQLLTDPAEASFFAIPIVVLVAAFVLVWRTTLAGQVVGILAALAAAMMMFWSAFGLAYPASFVDFVPGYLVPFGAVAAVGGGAAGLVQRRRQRLEPAATAGERRVLLLLAAGAALAVVASGVLSLTSGTTAGVEGDGQVSIRAFEFSAPTGTLVAGGTVVASNGDAIVHSFTIPALGIDETLLPGSSKAIELPADAAGAHVLYCRPHANLADPDPESAGMAMSIQIQ
jgi:plastocyanin